MFKVSENQMHLSHGSRRTFMGACVMKINFTEMMQEHYNYTYGGIAR